MRGCVIGDVWSGPSTPLSARDDGEFINTASNSGRGVAPGMHETPGASSAVAKPFIRFRRSQSIADSCGDRHPANSRAAPSPDAEHPWRCCRLVHRPRLYMWCGRTMRIMGIGTCDRWPAATPCICVSSPGPGVVTRVRGTLRGIPYPMRSGGTGN